MCDIIFRDHFNRTIKHDDPDLEKAEWVSITFRFQNVTLGTTR
jgi:hypothetical protein